MKGKAAVKKRYGRCRLASSIAEQYGFSLVYFDDSANLYQDVFWATWPCFRLSVLAMRHKGQALKTVTEMDAAVLMALVLKGSNPELIKMFNAGLKFESQWRISKILDKYIQK